MSIQPNHTYTFDYQMLQNWESLDEKDLKLAHLAYSYMNDAYAPYSKFNVGASVSLENGELLGGSNQENIAFPSGLCAERVVLFYAGAKFPGVTIDTLCIVAKGDLMPADQMLSPCGGCRQVMLESENRQSTPIRVILINQDGRTMILNRVKDILPFGFGIHK